MSEADLTLSELLQDKLGWLERDEYEERNRVGFQLERLTKTGRRYDNDAIALAARSGVGEM